MKESYVYSSKFPVRDSVCGRIVIGKLYERNRDFFIKIHPISRHFDANMMKEVMLFYNIL